MEKLHEKMVYPMFWFCVLLVGCGGQNDKADNDMKPDLEANLLYENTISPNEKYVENEADLCALHPSRCIK